MVTNSSNRAVVATVHADAGQHHAWVAASEEDVNNRKVRSDSVNVDLAPRSAVLVFVEVQAKKPVRRGKFALVVLARAHPVAEPGTRVVDAFDTRELDVELAGSDLLPTALGGGTVALALLVPGLLAVAAWLQVWVRDFRRLGLPATNSATAMWTNKWWLVLAVAVSLAAAWVYDRLFKIDLLDTYTWLDLLLASLGAALVAFVLSTLTLWTYRFWRPCVIGAKNSPAKQAKRVLVAAKRFNTRVERSVYLAPDGQSKGLLVHRDRGAYVLTPPISVSKPQGLKTAINERSDLKAAVKSIRKAPRGDRFDGRWDSNPRWLPQTAPATAVKWITEPIAILNPESAGQNPVRIVGISESD
ncbi:hypothetical protein ACFW5M_33825 [Streptomyces albogriseolus]|uniref:hypothetical protein n=1 Tax=Streptomyces albogriseolus TaxID=1887 RepID=UPI0036A1081A